MGSIVSTLPSGDLWIKILLAFIENADEMNKFNLNLPNVEFPTMGGVFFWDNLAENDGWRIQRNKLTKHCRVLDPADTRIAWGTETGMKEAFERLTRA